MILLVRNFAVLNTSYSIEHKMVPLFRVNLTVVLKEAPISRVAFLSCHC